MSQLGEVSVKVKRAILIMEKFTIAQIADISGLKYESVETVVQRLLRKGILVKVDGNFKQSIAKRGRPRQYYTFANSQTRKILKNEIDAFWLEKSLIEPDRQKPRNPHFMHATSLIEAVETGHKEPTDSLLEKIKLNLNLAREYEGMISPNPEIAMAYIDLLQARFEYLREEDEEAENFLKKAKKVFKNYHMTEEEQNVDEYYLTLKLKQFIQIAKKLIDQQEYHLLKDKLTEVLTSFPDDFISGKIGPQLKEILGFIAKLSTSANELKIRNEELEQRNEWLRKENFTLQVQQQLVTEINRELFQARGELTKKIDIERIYPSFQRPHFSFIEIFRISSLSPKIESSLERKRTFH